MLLETLANPGITTKGVYDWAPMFIKTVFKTFGLSDVLKITFSALNHVNNIRGFTSNSFYNYSFYTSRILFRPFPVNIKIL